MATTLTFLVVLGAIWAAAALLAKRHASASDAPVRDWFFVAFDDSAVTLAVRAAKPWTASFRFEDIVRVCLEMEPGAPFGMSHGLYVWVKERARPD